MQAYDLETLDQSIGENAPRGQGWCFGLPPGITPEQWPLDPDNGYPLMHGFTLLLPEDYRCHGPDIVALSFFSIAPCHQDGGPSSGSAAIQAAMQNDAQPADPHLQPFWQAQRTAHPRLFRMTDILGCPYAVILLTQTEFDGPFCPPPALLGNPYLEQDELPAPAWMHEGGALSYWRWQGSIGIGMAPKEEDLARMLSEEPWLRLTLNRAIRWTPRKNDPNAGKTPCEYYGDDPLPEDAYQSYYYWQDGKVAVENWREHEWAKGHMSEHIGGTMRPVQAIPEGFGPYYIEFNEALGGYNFGTGNAQLDFQNMRFDWAC